MSKNRLGPYSLGLISAIALFSIAIINPAFGEVSSIQTNSESFFRGDQIQFSGTVDQGSQGLVTIVIYDALEEFVMITQALINPDNTFDKTITVGDKFSQHGVHEATGFILNMTQGASTEFGVSMNGSSINFDEKEKEEISNASNVVLNEAKTNPSQAPSDLLFTADFVDSSKGAQYYIDRYYGEPAYKSWFDSNYPGVTIEQAVNSIASETKQQEVIEIEDKKEVENISRTDESVSSIIENEIIPEAEASTSNDLLSEPRQEPQDNSDIAQISLAVAGLGILFGAVYGIKRKVDDNSRQISINRDILRRKIIQPIIGSNPKSILQTRLAKGEITLEEYEKLKSKLS